MPSKDPSRSKWRAQVRHKGKLYRHDFPTKREAVEWEMATKKELESLQEVPEIRSPGDMDLAAFIETYLDHAELHFSFKTFDAKRLCCRRFIEFAGPVSVEEATPDLVNRFLVSLAKGKGASVSNNARKDLLALWNWGQTFLDLPANP